MARTKNSRNASGSGSIRQRPNGTWEGRYTAGIDKATGKTIRRSIYGKTQKEVRERLRQITNDIDTEMYVAPCAMKYSDWLQIWLKDYLIGRSLKRSVSTKAMHATILYLHWVIIAWMHLNLKPFRSASTRLHAVIYLPKP